MYKHSDKIWVRAILYPLTIYHIPLISEPIAYLLNVKLLWTITKLSGFINFPPILGFNVHLSLKALLNLSFVSAIFIIPILDHVKSRKDLNWNTDRSTHARLSIFIFFIIVSLLSWPANWALSSNLIFIKMNLLQKISLYSYTLLGCLAFCNLLMGGYLTFLWQNYIMTKIFK